MSTSHRHHAFAIAYHLLVAALGWGALLALWSGGPQPLPLETLLLFALLSTGVKRLGFRVARKVTHSLVGTVDLAALFIFGILGGSIVAAFHSESGPVLVLTVLALLSVGLGLRQLMVSLSEERRHVAQLTAIGEVSRKVAAILDLKTLFADTVKLIKDTFGYYHVSIFTVGPERREVTFQAGSSALIQQRGLTVPWGQGIICPPWCA